ncbi:MAG: hypothetical protein KC656_36775, partial [Myxococcales bacterium]|nr:hypothetical protein [Myxococcales bacterium]
FRIPDGLQQLLRGGWTCSFCGQRLDRLAQLEEEADGVDAASFRLRPGVSVWPWALGPLLVGGLVGGALAIGVVGTASAAGLFALSGLPWAIARVRRWAWPATLTVHPNRLVALGRSVPFADVENIERDGRDLRLRGDSLDLRLCGVSLRAEEHLKTRWRAFQRGQAAGEARPEALAALNRLKHT